MRKQLEIFPFNPPINLSGGGKWFLTATSSEATHSAFNITDENNSFSGTTAGNWNSKSTEKTIDKLNNFKSLGLKKVLNYM